mmetsp:Transcript_71909/g.166424  ORF Transcript_71909/g.166424 Transcript_71909/m.166424 type:complete len:244 (-) Transcript_71909:154-885(-)
MRVPKPVRCRMPSGVAGWCHVHQWARALERNAKATALMAAADAAAATAATAAPAAPAAAAGSTWQIRDLSLQASIPLRFQPLRRRGHQRLLRDPCAARDGGGPSLETIARRNTGQPCPDPPLRPSGALRPRSSAISMARSSPPAPSFEPIDRSHTAAQWQGLPAILCRFETTAPRSMSRLTLPCPILWVLEFLGATSPLLPTCAQFGCAPHATTYRWIAGEESPRPSHPETAIGSHQQDPEDQ